MTQDQLIRALRATYSTHPLIMQAADELARACCARCEPGMRCEGFCKPTEKDTADPSLTTSARLAIRIAETYLPDSPSQKDLATDIVNAINLCEAELGEDIIRQMRPRAHQS